MPVLNGRKYKDMNYKVLALCLFSVYFIYRLVIDLLDWRSMKNPVPANVADVFDEAAYQKWRNYHVEKARIGLISSCVEFVIVFLALALNWYSAFAELFPDGFVWQLFAVLLFDSLIHLITLPLSYYNVMNIEEKYGFNRSTKKTFWVDQLKSFLISLIILTLIGMLIITIHVRLGDWLIPVMAIALTVILLGFTFLYPFFSKIFNKFTPLEEGELKEKLTALLQKNGYQVRAIQVMDASKRSTKMNAYFTGFGKMKTIVLYDTLKEAMSTDEICAVFAHEMGHGLHKDTLKNQILTFIQMFLLAFLAWFTLRTPGWFTDFGFEGINYGFAMLLIMSVEFAVFAPLYGLLVNVCSRKAEYRADAQAVKEGYGEALISALKLLAKGNFANLSPDPLVVKLEYSHPTLSARIDAIEKQLAVGR